MIENLFSLEGKVALVTGGAKGIGAMISQGLVESGAKVYVSSRSAEACENFAQEMSKIGQCAALPADLSSLENIDNLVKELTQKESKIDILINNAGATWGHPLGDFPEKGWDKVMNLNVKSIFFLTQAMLPLLRAAASKESPSRVVNISSIMAEMPFVMNSWSYSPSKAALKQMTRNLANELTKEQILVNCIGPGFFPTKMTAFMDKKQMAGIAPIGRGGQASDIAGLVIYLCSKAGSFMAGNFIPLDGGILMK